MHSIFQKKEGSSIKIMFFNFSPKYKHKGTTNVNSNKIVKKSNHNNTDIWDILTYQ